MPKSPYTNAEINLFHAMCNKPTPAGKPPLSSERAARILIDAFSAFPEYVNTVVRCEQQLPLIRATAEREEMIARVESLDKLRNAAHNAAISSLTMLNRNCDYYGVARIADIDTNNRYAVGDFCACYTMSVFENRQSGGMEAALESGRLYTVDATTLDPSKQDDFSL